MKAIAAVLDRINGVRPFAETKPLRLATVELASPGIDELLVKIEAAGLCHSDLSVINGDRPRPLPMAIGHEAVATVIEAGDTAAKQFAAGDRIVMSFLPPCGICRECQSGEGYMCPNGAAANGRGTLLSGDIRIKDCGQEVHHHLGASAFASHAVIDRRSAVKIPADVPVEIAALFGCAVLTGVGAVLNTAALRAGESVIIYGLGGVGLDRAFADTRVVGGLQGGGHGPA